ncbi:putative phosphohydrolase [Sphaerochaeta pleomorpha str. Grapes]|uniref:Putative phosphohydrolase n=1 Tax=Sphaerochaeta pleomorpha (strain ATCC BAA-1885 / DSM 22778 / Grapes) TaxID=158190 RepID=G8QS34_SPHPG|nr:metallophosphoesterase [Sphaerochaeta pleomorpha]AEV28895.1 putative phosphohydrolase [Sphaerochaeta pleomorpha str. Grapes]
MKNQHRTSIIVFACLLLVLGFLSYSVIDRLLNTKTFESVDRETEVFQIPQHPYSEKEAETAGNAFPLEYPEDGKFTILWGTDFHLRRGPFANRDKIYSLLEKAFAETDPDLTVITGDLLFSFNGKAMLSEFAAFMEKNKQYWAYCLGNHDGEYTYTRKQLASQLAEYPHALFSSGEDWVLGESNYVITLTEQGKPVQALVFLDSHDARAYAKRIGPDYIYPSQVAWYRWVSEGLGKVPLYTFFHIPLPEYKELWESGKAEGLQHDSKINAPLENSGFFEAMVEDGDTVATFCGHDHLNDFSGNLEGIELVTGRSASYGSYGASDFPKGVKTLTLYRNKTPFAMHTYTIDDWQL